VYTNVASNPEKLATFVYTRYRTKTIQRNWQHLCTQDTGRNYKYSRFCFVEIRKSNHVEKSIYMYILIYDKSLVNLFTLTLVFSSGKKVFIQSRETGNICVHRIQDKDNPEKLATFVYTGYRTKTIQRN
jgi:hypothetical protein